MGLAHELGKTIGRALAPVRAGEDGLASRVLAVLDRRTLSVTSSAFTDGGSLPRSLARSLVHRRQRGPRLPSPRVEQRPRGHALEGGHRRGRRRAHAQALRPLARLRHPTSVGSVQGAQRLEGKNSKLGVGFTPAAPPVGHGVHHYHFQVFALDTAIDLERGAGRSTLLEEMRGHVLAWGDIVATCERS